jgi:hypothetical protein
MKVYGIEITTAQRDAGRAAMRGEFRMTQVVDALMCAGVPDGNFVAARAADRLLQSERKAGRIRAVNNKLWAAQ